MDGTLSHRVMETSPGACRCWQTQFPQSQEGHSCSQPAGFLLGHCNRGFQHCWACSSERFLC